jgi:hypothetical protein
VGMIRPWEPPEVLDGYPDSTPFGCENHLLMCGFTPVFSISYAALTMRCFALRQRSK